MEKKKNYKIYKYSKIILLTLLFLTATAYKAKAAPPDTNFQIPKISITVDDAKNPKEYVNNVKLLILLTTLTFIPAILTLMTSFTRIIVVLGFVRSALSTQQSPPNQVLIGLAFFMTLFIMTPTYNKINQDAIKPYVDGAITQEQAIENGSKPLKDFMLKQTREKDLALFYKSANMERPKDRYEVPFRILVPAFAISELKTAFQMGFLIFIPFVIIDMVVASILMSMGMFMLPPVAVSLPFKLLLFVLADGWNLVVKSLLQSFM